MPGRIRPVKLGRNSLYASLVELGIIPMNSTGIYRNGYKCNLSEFTPILTSMSCPVKFDRPVKLGVNPLRLRPPNSTRQPYYVQADIQM